MRSSAKKKSVQRKTAAPSLRPLRMPNRTVALLPNGMTVSVVKRGTLPLVAVRYMNKSGSVFDPPGRFGLAELTARLLRRGANGKSADELNDAVDYVGASLAAWASEDSFGVGMTTPSAHFQSMLELFTSVLQKPDFLEQEVSLAQRRTLAQLTNLLDEPEALADRALGRSLFGEHAYGHETIGVTSDLQSMTRDDLAAFHREKIGPQGAHLFVVGNLDVDATMQAIEQAFGRWTQQASPQPTIPEWTRLHAPGDVIIVDKPEQTQVQIRLASKGVPRGHADHFPLTVMNCVLGGSFTSRLMQEIRVKRGLTYGAGSHFDQMAHGGIFAISSFTKTETVAELLEVALGEVAKMRNKGPKPPELMTAQRYISGLYPARFETNESIAGALADMALYGLPEDWVDQYRERVMNVTVASATEAAKQHLPVDERLVVLVGNADQLVKTAEQFGKVRVIPAAELA